MSSRYKICVSGKNPKYFVNELIKKKINIYDITFFDRYVYLIVNEYDLEKILDIKTSYKIEIVQIYGLNKYKFFIKNNLILIFSFLFGISVICFLSNIIFNVEVVHSNSMIRKIVYKDLKYYGIEKYKFKVDDKKLDNIVSLILKKEIDNLEWMEIEEVGTKYIVKVQQRKKNNEEEFCKNRNIVAKKDSMILNIEASSGEILRKKYDYVRKGDVLISGLIHNKEDIVSKKCAVGKVFGEVWYKVNITLPVFYKSTVSTGRSNYGISFRILNKEYNFFNKFLNSKKERVKIIGSSLLPVDFSVVKYSEIKINEKKYTINNVDEDSLVLAEQKIKMKLNDGEEVLSKKVLKKLEKKSKIYIDIFIKVKEEISAYQDISKIDIDYEKKNDKRE